MLSQNELTQTFPQQFSASSATNTSGAVDSIFILMSLLSATIKDYISTSDETVADISKLKQEIIILLAENTISDEYFSHIDARFYLLLSTMKGYQRLARLIINEKRHIDISIGEAIKTQENYKKICRTYTIILNGIQTDNYSEASRALNELSKTLRSLVLKM